MSEKDRLLEIMGKVNPSFINEEDIFVTNDGVEVEKLPDVHRMSKALDHAKTLDYYHSRINTPEELENALKVWFGSTGFDPVNRPITITNVQSMIRRVMESLGYR